MESSFVRDTPLRIIGSSSPCSPYQISCVSSWQQPWPRPAAWCCYPLPPTARALGFGRRSWSFRRAIMEPKLFKASRYLHPSMLSTFYDNRSSDSFLSNQYIYSSFIFLRGSTYVANYELHTLLFLVVNGTFFLLVPICNRACNTSKIWM
jgi:hypothetical protein